ncbi:BC1881 family protein [Loktanella sp. Alg231-35]|uniref:BC1881 family protein n=1 Tax=Loktanella sp. Alg231-35 TaxID=1922220 RepID=UPI000D5571C7
MQDSVIKIDLTNITTCELHRELLKREGVQSCFLGPEDKLFQVVRGPAWVIVNRD